jgi:STE24 endopeptidase
MLRRLLLVFALAAAAAMAQSPAPAAPTLEQQKQVKTYTLPPEKLAKAIAYSRAKNWLHFIEFAYSAIVLVGLLAWKVAPRFRDRAQAVSQRRIVQAYIFVPLLFLTLDVLDLPTSLYEQHLSLEYGQSIQGWGSWFWDWTKGELIEFALAGVLVWILYGVIRRSARRWWFYFWLAFVPIVVFLQFLAPVVVAPLFNKFEPLAAKQPALVTEIEKVTARGGLAIPRDHMFEMKASEKMNSLNAYVAGIGASKRVVVWDTTLQKMTTPQILFVFGHEMGHYVLGHILLLIVAQCLLLLIFLYAGFLAMDRLIQRAGKSWNIRSVDDWASLPLLLLVVTVVSFVMEPAMNSFSRVLEHNADVYGLEVVHGIVPDAPQTAAQAFQILGEVDLSDPDPSPFIKFWLYNHPALPERIRFAAQYDPWSTGTPKYVK